jgi:hypothetical protein
MRLNRIVILAGVSTCIMMEQQAFLKLVGMTRSYPQMGADWLGATV